MRERLPGILLWSSAVLVPAAAFAVLRLSPSLDARLALEVPEGHFFMVTAVALAALALSGIAIVATLRTPSARLTLITLGFMSIGGIFAVHGLATPGFLLSERYSGVTGFSARLTFLVAAICFAASALHWRGAAGDWIARHRRALITLWAAGILAYAVFALLRPEWLPPAATRSTVVQVAGTVAVCVLGAFTASRYLAAFSRTRLPLFGAMVLGTILLVEAQLSQHLGPAWQGTFWLYHVQLALGAGAIATGVLLEYARGASPSQSLARLGETDTVAQIAAGYTSAITSLAAALEARDGYTLGHGERVAALSVLMGEELGLSAGRLRALGQGALLHDIGKIGVPDQILHKPGPLSDEEFRTIQEHPARGHAVLRSALGVDVERQVIRHHHERWDGAGYPDGLAAEGIPLEARIVAVADVYDALRSARSYREAWNREDAVEQVQRSAGTHLDPRCVDAFLRVVDRWEMRFAAEDVAYEERRRVA